MFYLLTDTDVMWMLGGEKEVMISISLRPTIILHQILHTVIVTTCGEVCRRSGD